MLESFNPKAPLAQTLNKIPFILQIIIGLAFGVLVAYIYPDDKTVIPTFGTLFVKALKAVAPLLIFVLVTSAIAKHKSGSQTNLKPIIALYFAGMVISGTLALGLSYLFPSTFTELAASENVSAPKGVVEVLVNFVNQAVENPVSAFINCNFVAILVWSIALGLMFRVSKESTKLVLDDVATAVSGVIRFVIRCAPLGVFGLVYNSCTQEGGFSNLLNYVHVVGVLVLTMFIVALIFNPLLVFLTTGKVKRLYESSDGLFVTRSVIQAPALLEPYNLFGLDCRFRCSYTPLQQTSFITVNKKDVMQHLMKLEIFRINYFNLLSAIIHRKEDQLQPLGNPTIKNKTIQFMQRQFADCKGPAEIVIKMTDLANYIGETRLNTSRVLNQMEDENIIELNRSLIVIPELQKLKQE